MRPVNNVVGMYRDTSGQADAPPFADEITGWARRRVTNWEAILLERGRCWNAAVHMRSRLGMMRMLWNALGCSRGHPGMFSEI